MDMIYEVCQVELGLMEVLQLIELTYGEGKYFFEIIFNLLCLFSKECNSKAFLF